MPIVATEKTVEIPQADGLPVLGSALDMLRDPLQFLIEQRKKHGPVFRVKAGPRSIVILSGVEANRFMSEEGKACFISKNFWGRIVDRWQCPHFISALDGPQHIEERRNLKPTFSRSIADSNQAGLTQLVHDTVSRLRDRQGSISVRVLTRTLTNNELYYLLTGDLPDLPARIAKALAEYQRITFNVLVLGKWPSLVLYSPHYLFYQHQAMRFVKQLRARFEQQAPEDGFFAIVEKLRQLRPDMGEGDINFMYLAPFWAGLDTLGASMVFLIHELVHSPALYAEVELELEKAMQGKEQLPEISELRKLPKLYGLCMETLRKYPVAFGNGRTAAQDFDLDGYSIKKGEEVLVFTSATHFDEEYFPDPQNFDIHRYSGERNEHRQKYVFNPYGRGPHICLGAAMAESMLINTVATLILNYRFKACEPYKQFPMIFDPSPTMSTKFRVFVEAK